MIGALSRSSFGPRSSSNFLLTISVRNLGSAHFMSGWAASSLRVVGNALYRSSTILSLFVVMYLVTKSSSSPSVTWTPTPEAASKSDSTQSFSLLWDFKYSTAATSSAIAQCWKLAPSTCFPDLIRPSTIALTTLGRFSYVPF